MQGPNAGVFASQWKIGLSVLRVALSYTNDNFETQYLFVTYFLNIIIKIVHFKRLCYLELMKMFL